MARESKKGGSVKSNAAAIQRSGRRGMLVSLLIGLLLLLILISGWSEQTQGAQAVVKMHSPKARNVNAAAEVHLPECGVAGRKQIVIGNIAANNIAPIDRRWKSMMPRRQVRMS